MDWREEPLRSPHPSREVTSAGKQEVLPNPLDWREELLPPSGSTTGAASAGSRLLALNERTLMRDAVMDGDVAARHPECRSEERIAFTIGHPYPRTTRVCPFPDEVRAKLPKARRYRYLVAAGEVLVIDPADHRIVDVLE
jgi:hypothetical protein